MVDRKTFLSLLSKHLYPILRAEGFKGSGTTLRRIDGPVIHVFHVQGSMSGNQCYLNLGAHLSFLPASGGAIVHPEKLDEPHCVFRDRMEPPSGRGLGWAYCNTMEEARENVEFIVSEWPSLGHGFFNRYKSFPESFATLILQIPPSSIHPAHCLDYARIAKELGQNETAAEFAKSALERLGERATSLRGDLAKILAGADH